MADLNTGGFGLSELPPPITLPNTITHFDVGAVYDAAKKGLDLADTYRQIGQAAYSQPAQMENAVSQNELGTEQAQSQRNVLPSATDAQIAQNVLAAGRAQKDAGLLDKYALATGAGYDAAAAQEGNKALYYGAENAGGQPQAAAQAQTNAARGAAANPSGINITPISIPGQPGQQQAAPAAQATPGAALAAGASTVAPVANGGIPTYSGSVPIPSMAASSAPAAGPGPVLAGGGAGTSAPQAQVSQGAPAAPQGGALAAGAGGSYGGGQPIGMAVTQIGPDGQPQTRFQDLPLAAIARIKTGSSVEPLINPRTGGPMLGLNGGMLMQRYNTYANGAKIADGDAKEGAAPTAEQTGAGGAGTQTTGQQGGGSAPSGAQQPSLVPNVLKLDPAKITSPSVFPFVAAPLTPPVVNTAGLPTKVANQEITKANDEYQSEVKHRQLEAQNQIQANTNQAERSDTLLLQLHNAFDAATQKFGLPNGILQVSQTAQNAAIISSPQYQLARAYAIQQFASNIPKGLNRVTQLEWSNLISSSISPNNDAETNAALKANIEKVINRKNDLNAGYNQYVSNSQQRTDEGWPNLESGYLSSNGLAKPDIEEILRPGKTETSAAAENADVATNGVRLPFNIYSHLLSAGVQDPNAYVKANGIPSQQALLAASQGRAPLPTFGQNGYYGGVGQIRTLAHPIDPTIAKVGVGNMNGYQFKVLGPNQIIITATPNGS